MLTIADSSDADLARAVAARDPSSADAAEGELYRRFAPRVRLFGMRHLRNEDAARDLVQQVMLRTIEKLRGGSVRDVDRIASFILGVSRSMAKDRLRTERRRETLLDTFADAEAVAAPVGRPPTNRGLRPPLLSMVMESQIRPRSWVTSARWDIGRCSSVRVHGVSQEATLISVMPRRSADRWAEGDIPCQRWYQAHSAE